MFLHSLTCTRHIHVDVQYTVETAHGTPDVICIVCQHYEVKQTSALTFLMIYSPLVKIASMLISGNFFRTEREI